MASDPHEWHTFDAEAGLEVRQATDPGEPNRWEVRSITDPDAVTVLDDAEFEQLREHGPNPQGI
jgi:hypothetical protein